MVLPDEASSGDIPEKPILAKEIDAYILRSEFEKIIKIIDKVEKTVKSSIIFSALILPAKKLMDILPAIMKSWKKETVIAALCGGIFFESLKNVGAQAQSLFLPRNKSLIL